MRTKVNHKDVQKSIIHSGKNFKIIQIAYIKGMVNILYPHNKALCSYLKSSCFDLISC